MTSATASTAQPSSPSASAGSGSRVNRNGCAPKPAACGYPDATNTGVPGGTALRTVPSQVSTGPGWHWDSRGWVEIDGDGAVFSGYAVAATVDVTASDVAVRGNRITLTGESFGIALRHTTNVTVEGNTITSPAATGTDRLLVGLKDIYGDASGTKVVANDVSHASTGVQVDSGVIQDNYIHDMGYTSGDHLNGITSNAGSSGLIISHNTVLNNYAQTDAIGLFEDFGPQTNRVINDNLLGGGGYTLYAGANPGGSRTSNIRITDNRFATVFWPAAGYYGPSTAYDPAGPGNVWSGNTWDSTGDPLGS
jgi:hypothetical protein